MPDRRNASRRRRHRRVPYAAALALTIAALQLATAEARADLRICNVTPGRIGVAIGYQDGQGWATEGWWNVAGATCETLLKGKLGSRFYYVHAVDYDRGGEWTGKTTMCADDKTFWIKGNGDCEKRGHRSVGFMEVDTNDSRDWTIRLSDPPDSRKGK